MDINEKFDSLKKEVRSILITYQNGCSLNEFNHSYKTYIGRGLPVAEFSYRSAIELLSAMPDVVRVTKSYSGEYHLFGIADKDTIHIQKMVCKQKPSKGKPVRSRSRNYNPPPRFYVCPQTNGTQYNKSVPTSFQFSKSSNPFQSNRRDSFQSNRSDPIQSNRSDPIQSNRSDPIQSNRSDPIQPNRSEPFQSNRSEPFQSNRSEPFQRSELKAAATPDSKAFTQKEVCKSNAPPVTESGPQTKVIELVKYYKNGIPLSEILYEYEQMHENSLPLSDYGFSSIEECLADIEEITIFKKDGDSWAIHNHSEASGLVENNHNSTSNDDQGYGRNLSTSENMPSRPHSRASTISDKGIPSSLIVKLQQVAQKYSKLLSYEFPVFFEKVTKTQLDLQSLGYKCLADFIDDVPEIFCRRSVVGTNNFVIYPASSIPNNDSHVNENGTEHLSIVEVIENLKQILLANPEGIVLDNLESIYEFNCKCRLSASDFGFSDLEVFLNNIKNRVPLKVEFKNGVRRVYPVRISEVVNLELPYSAAKRNHLPDSAASPKSEFKPPKLPNNSISKNYIPVYVSSIINPSHFYLQFTEEAITVDYGKLADEMDNFYNGKQSESYKMENADIQVATSCAALWPVDRHWYRAQILSISAMGKVLVNYVDYGTRDEIPASLLRYLKKDFLKLPIQALECSLSFLKPPNNAKAWNKISIQKFLEMCKDIPLMAKIEEKKSDGTCSVVLCDTNKEEDIFLNDELVAKEVAEYAVPADNANGAAAPIESPTLAIPGPGLEETSSNYNPFHVYQAHQYLLLFASVLPSFSTNKNYLGLLKDVADLLLQMQPAVGMPNQSSFNLFPSGMNSFANSLKSSYPLTQMVQGANIAGLNSLKGSLPRIESSDLRLIPPIGPPTSNYVASNEISSGLPVQENKEDENDIFEDDDDSFEKFCQEVVSKPKRFIKRVVFTEGYKIHIINHDSKAFASSGDISLLIWNNRDTDFLFRRLQSRETDFSSSQLFESGNEELFSQLERFQVKGIQKRNELQASILVYPLKVVIKILNEFGHPSALLRTELTTEVSNFNPNDAIWKENSFIDLVQPGADGSLTDDDKIDKLDQLDRLCLYDLRAMKEGINQRRLTILSQLNRGDSEKYVDEIAKLEKVQKKVLQRIEEINEICLLFS